MPELGRKGAATLSRILQSAEELIAAKGFDRTSVAEIAEASGIAKPTLYHYFRSKEEIAVEILRQGWADFSDVVRKSELQNVDLPQQMRYIVRGFLDIHERNSDLHWRLLREFGRTDNPLSQRLWENTADLTHQLADALVAKGRKAGLLRQDLEPETIAFTFHSMITLFLYADHRTTLKHVIPSDRGGLADYLVDLFLTGMSPHAPIDP